MKLKDKVALITGFFSRIGKAIVLLFTEVYLMLATSKYLQVRLLIQMDDIHY